MNQIEQRVKAVQASVKHLTLAILANAFSDELTANWCVQNSEFIICEKRSSVISPNQS